MEKRSRVLPVIAALIVAAGLLAGCTPDGSDGDTGSGGPVELGNYDNAVTVTPALDTGRAVTETIGFAGGTISATAADGTAFTLTVPADSMRQTARITLTPVVELAGLPFGDGTAHAVDLQPAGLVFDRPATLTIQPATPLPPAEQILYGYADSRLTLAQPMPGAEGTSIAVFHSSGYGVTRGSAGNLDPAELARLGGNAEERIGSRMRAEILKERERQLRGEPGTSLNELLPGYFKQYEREVILPRIAAARQSCAHARLAIQTKLGYDRQLLLVGLDDNVSNHGFTDLVETAATRCMDEEYRMCVEQHVVARILHFYVPILRELELLGMDTSGRTDTVGNPLDGVKDGRRKKLPGERIPADYHRLQPILIRMKEQVEGCLHFELDFQLTTISDTDLRTRRGPHARSTESTRLTTEVAFRLDRFLLFSPDGAFVPASGPMKAIDPQHQFAWHPWQCGITSFSPWQDTGHFLGMLLGESRPENDQDAVGIEWIRVAIRLPAPGTSFTMMCPGAPGILARQPQTGDNLPTAPAVYRDLHEDKIIRGWKIHGGEIFATADWRNMKRPFPGITLEDAGKATLRHTPR